MEYSFTQQSLGHIIEDKAKTCGDKTFLEFEDGVSLTYAECNEMSNRVANGMIKLGLRQGETLATFIPNSVATISLWFGAAKAGIVEVPINLANKGNFLSHIIDKSDCKAIVIDQQLLERLMSIENLVPQLQTVVVWSRPGEKTVYPDSRFRMMDYDELTAGSPNKPEVVVKSNDPQMMIYTSGTTGAAKGVLQPHSMIYHSANEYIEALRATPDDILFTCLPLFHANARILCIYPAMLLETKAVIYERFSASRFWDQIRKHGATIFNSLGALASFIYSQPRRPDDAENPIRVCAAYPMPPEIYHDYERRYGLKVVEGYGLTELAIITYNPYDKPKIRSCGKATKNFEIKIVDGNDWPVPAGTVGEIVARGRIPWAAALGYYNMPDKTLELTRNCFYHTGDAGHLDEEGYLFFKGRIKDYIRRRGENISSEEIEGVVSSHPKVEDCAAIAVKSELSEDEVMIFVVLKLGEEVPPDELLGFCGDRMPYFAVPRYVEYVVSLPKTATAKVQKVKLREIGVTPTTWDREKAGYKVNR